ncbi:MAG TPA: hypothetical protein VNN80_31245, partial [Polyangiaceae bacterium]|nr:hypothetical protein [Polyangiaceae bacterium]
LAGACGAPPMRATSVELEPPPAPAAAPTPTASTSAAAPAAPHVEPPEPEPEPTPPVAHFEALPVADHLDAVVALPAATGRQPILFATHGAGGAPEHHCAAWRQHLGQRGIIVCLRGVMVNRLIGPEAGFYYPNHHALEQELLATLESFEAAYADRILPESYVYAGYSQGATMGALMLPPHAGRFKRVLLVEGGFADWPLASARRFTQSGGERVAFVCGVATCHRGAEQSAQILTRADSLALSKYAPGAGHTYSGAVADRIREALPWLLENHPGWQTPDSSQ